MSSKLSGVLLVLFRQCQKREIKSHSNRLPPQRDGKNGKVTKAKPGLKSGAMIAKKSEFVRI